MFKCIIDDVLAALYEFIFVVAIGLLITLIRPLIKQITKEKINNYTTQIKSLISSKIDKVKDTIT